MSKFIPFRLAVLATCMAVVATGCGGSDDDDDGGTPPGGGQVAPQATISGTAAAGLPLTGTVTVKDAAGRSRTSAIGANGQYTVSVEGLTAPFVFRAEGSVSGNPFIVHSAATSGDVGGTINITPLTDLVIANVAGRVASAYFDQGQFGGLGKADLDAEAAKLKEKLLPVLLAIGVEGSIDLLRTPFTPLSSALDTALDQLRVSIDSASGIATITNLVTQQALQDDLAVKAAQELAPATMDNVANVNASGSDIPAVRAALLAFSAKFSAGLPAPGVLTPLMSEDFLDRDRGRQAFADDLVTQPDLVGARFTNVVIESIDYEAPGGAIATVDLDIVDAQGHSVERQTGFRLRKGADGTWRLHGDGRVMDMETDSSAFHSVQFAGSVGGEPCRSAGVSFEIVDLDEANNGGAIAMIRAQGPGLPAEGVRLVAPPTGGYWQLALEPGSAFSGGNIYYMTSTCMTPVLTDAEIAALPPRAAYTLTAYTAGGAKVPLGSDPSGTYRMRTRGQRPHTLAELKAATFPVVAAPSAVDFSAYTGGALTFSVSGLMPHRFAGLSLFARNDQTSESVENDLAVGPTGSSTTTVTLLLNGATGKSLRVSTTDDGWRSIVTGWDHYSQ